ncbi:hypothetical protein BIZ37_16445 [Photobacterium sp. BZF1]|uniref:SGNH/GDSL hydrolase family protein n=1 Tax=Photobacterium sp. BZF1 TaxID=1904457 RepID=UPI001653C9E2|nr:GDSL-type esterase/lipase family protein [Photobacterium sp. BZF1]MBC7004154.1 hypothetical protein [Photobacterium sp. BZF1]
MIKKLLIFSIFLNLALIGGGVSIFSIDELRVVLYKNLVYKIGTPQVFLAGDSLTRRNSDLVWFVGKSNFNVVNKAVDGHTILQVHRNIQDSILPKNPCLVVVMAGTNRQENISIERSLEVYEEVIKEIKSTHSDIIVLETPLTKRQRLNEYINQLNANLKEITKNNNVEFFPTNTIISKSGELNSDYTQDGVHFNSNGYKILNDSLVPFIKSAYKAKRFECENIF